MAAEIGFQGHVEQLDINLADVVPHPFLENLHHELAVLFAAYRTVGDHVASLGVEQALFAGPFAPAQVGDLDRLRRGALDDRDELHPLRAQFVAEEAIDGAAVFFVGGIDGAQDVEFDSVLAKVAANPSSPCRMCPVRRGPHGRCCAVRGGRRRSGRPENCVP